VREKAKIDNVQFVFMGGKGTTAAILVVRPLHKNYLV